MEQPKKIRPALVDIPRECPRCNQVHCPDCVDFVEVDFEVEDDSEDGNWKEHQWKGEDVCPWCYNQLVDMAFPPKSSNTRTTTEKASITEKD